MENTQGDRIGCVVRVHMMNGVIFTGIVLMWDSTCVYLSTQAGELIEIRRTEDISAVVYIVKKDGSLLHEKDLNRKNSKPRLTKEQKDAEEETTETVQKTQEKKSVERLKSLAELQKLKAISEREMASAKLKTSHVTAKPVEYHDPVSILQSLKNDTRNKG